MKTLGNQIAAVMITAAVFAQATSSVAIFSAKNDPPILQYLELVPRGPDPGSPNIPNFAIGKLLLTIQSVRSVTMQPDRKGVTVVLNETDRKKFAELTHKFVGKLLFCQVSQKPWVGGIRFISALRERCHRIQQSALFW